jgi:crotonobetainyl-CoA:carnitine CoA-transferase CaiB-like acyl-CoA transferase
MGRPELANDPQYITVAERNKNEKKLIPIIDDWVDSFDDLNKLEELLMKNGIPCARVKTVKDLINDPHLNNDRKTLIEVDVPVSETMPKLKIRGTAIKFSKTPGRPGSAPGLGQHQEEVLKLIAN